MTLKSDWVDVNTPGKTAPDWTFTSTAANDVADAVNGLTEVAVSVKSYGAVGDGETDDTGAVHAARDAAGVGGTVVFPPGTYLVGALALNVADQTWQLGAATLQYSGSTGITVTVSAAGVTLKGSGSGKTTITSPSEDGVLALSGASDIAVADLTVESTATPTGVTNLVAYNGGALQKRITVTGCRFIGSTNNAVDFPGAVEQLTFADNIVEDCKIGFTLTAPTVASGLISTQLVISRNRFRNVGGVNLQLYSAEEETATIVGVEISGNDLRDFDPETTINPGGPIPIEPNGGIDQGVISGNVIDGEAKSGISLGLCTNMIIAGNVIRNQRQYAVELNGGRQISIIGNIAENCDALVHETSEASALTDVVVADNIYKDSGLPSYQSTDVIQFYHAKRVRISRNLFYNWQYTNSAIRLGMSETPAVEDCVVDDNTFVISDANTPLGVVNISTAIRTNVVRNIIRVNRNLVATFETGDDSRAAIIAAMDNNCADTLIEGNHIMFTGTTSAAPDAAGIANNFATAGTCPGLVIHGNHVIDGPQGIYLRATSTDLRVYDNNTSTCTYPDTVPSTADSGTGTVASYAGEITLPANTDVVTLTGTDTVTSITASYRGRRVTLINTSTASLADGGNLKLSAAGPNTADDTITLVCDGTNWYEVARSVN